MKTRERNERDIPRGGPGWAALGLSAAAALGIAGTGCGGGGDDFVATGGGGGTVASGGMGAMAGMAGPMDVVGNGQMPGAPADMGGPAAGMPGGNPQMAGMPGAPGAAPAEAAPAGEPLDESDPTIAMLNAAGAPDAGGAAAPAAAGGEYNDYPIPPGIGAEGGYANAQPGYGPGGGQPPAGYPQPGLAGGANQPPPGYPGAGGGQPPAGYPQPGRSPLGGKGGRMDEEQYGAGPGGAQPPAGYPQPGLAGGANQPPPGYPGAGGAQPPDGYPMPGLAGGANQPPAGYPQPGVPGGGRDYEDPAGGYGAPPGLAGGAQPPAGYPDLGQFGGQAGAAMPPGLGPGGPGGGMIDGQGGIGGLGGSGKVPSFENPIDAANTFVTAITTSNSAMLADCIAKRAVSDEAVTRKKELFASMADASISASDLAALSADFADYKVWRMLPAKSTGTRTVILSKEVQTKMRLGTGSMAKMIDRPVMYTRSITLRKEADGWKVMDYSNPSKLAR